jgi:hypothetical protein
MQSAGIIRQPRIARALNRYKAEVKPEIEMLRKKAGLTAEAAAGKGAEFISLIPATEEMLPSVATPMGTVPLRFRSKTTRFARRAEGMAARYETDLPEVLRASYREVTQKARLRDFYEHSYANVHRGVYQLAERATAGYEGAREKVREKNSTLKVEAAREGAEFVLAAGS